MRCLNSAPLIGCIAWLLPEIFYSGLPADSYHEKGIILVTNIEELVEYVLLPHKDDVTASCAEIPF